MKNRLSTVLGLAACLLAPPACDDSNANGSTGDTDGHDHNAQSEIITTVVLTFTPDGGGNPVTARFSDPDGDGGISGMADPISLSVGTTYTLTVEFLDELTDPAQDITVEVREEAEQHQVFVSGTTVEGPATTHSGALVTHAYADLESTYGSNAEGDDLPVGLSNTITANTAGSGTFEVTLRHLPELNGVPVKDASLPESLAAGDPLPGDVDAKVTFDLTVV